MDCAHVCLRFDDHGERRRKKAHRHTHTTDIMPKLLDGIAIAIAEMKQKKEIKTNIKSHILSLLSLIYARAANLR